MESNLQRNIDKIRKICNSMKDSLEGVESDVITDLQGFDLALDDILSVINDIEQEEADSFIIQLEYYTDKHYIIKLRMIYDKRNPKLLVPVRAYQMLGWDEKYINPDYYFKGRVTYVKYMYGWLKSAAFYDGEIYQAKVTCDGGLMYLQQVKDIKKEGGTVYIQNI